MKTIAIAAAVGALALAWASPQAQARTCVRQSVTGPAGHHTMMKCTTGRHHAARGARRTVTRTTRTVVTDDYITTTAPSRRVSRYYSVRMPRNTVVGYGSSYNPGWYGAQYQSTYAVPYAPARARWGYGYHYGSSFVPTWQASASSHPAYYGGSGGFAYHPGYGWGY